MSTSSSLTARQTLLQAIFIEARNAKIYEALAQLLQGYDDSVTRIFLQMAEEERQHGAELEQRYHERFGPSPSLVPEPQEVIEAPDLDDPEALIFDAMTIERALEACLRAEETTREFYRREAANASDPELQKMFRELGEFEETHVHLLKERLAEVRRASDPPPR
jgi:rubrerythrin